METNIKKARELSGKTQKECADFLGITLRAWQGYEYGQREAKYEVLCKIADMFGVTTDYLLCREVKSNPLDQLTSIEREKIMMKKIFSLPPEMRERIYREWLALLQSGEED